MANRVSKVAKKKTARRDVRQNKPDDHKDYGKPDDKKTPLTVVGLPCSSSLTVIVFRNADLKRTGKFEKDDELLPGVTVTVDNVERRTLITGAQGEAVFKELPAANYSLSVDAPFEYDKPEFFLLGKGIQPGGISVSGKTVVEVRLRAKEIEVRGCAFVDSKACGDQNKRIALEGVTVNISNDQGPITCVKTGWDGCFTARVPSSGLIALNAAAEIEADGCTYVRLDPCPILLTPQACQCSVTLAYTPSLAEVLAEALLVDDAGNVSQLSGIVFDLYKGPVVASSAERQATAGASRPACFSDLPSGLYSIAANAASYKKQGLELVDPLGVSKVISLSGGDKAPLTGSNAFLFRSRGARLSATVRDLDNGLGIPNVAIVMRAADGSGVPKRLVTGAGGTAVFEGVPSGQQIVRLEQTRFVSNHVEYVAAKSECCVAIGSSGMASVEFEVEKDIHAIFGNVSDLTGAAVPHAVVLIQDENGNDIAQVVADESGAYEWISPTAGRFFVSLALDPAGRPAKRQLVALNSKVEANIVDQGKGGVPPPSTVKDLSSAVIDIGSYPVLTEDIGSLGSPSVSSPFGLPSAPSGRIVQSALREVLGWRPNSADPKAFIAALTQSFDCKDVQGHTECVWVPRTYSVQADLGAVTGAQASIFARAKAALDQSLPLLDGLKPLRSSFDTEDGNAVREIVRFNWSELVNELGRVGGPRVQRVDEQFNALLGLQQFTSGEKVGGQLGRLQKVFGLKRKEVNTIEEEENLTNFLIVVDLINSLRSSWTDQRRFFSRDDDDVFFGTHSVLLSRALAVVAESVDEARFAMDSVFVGQAERQTIELEFNFQGLAKESMLVGDLLEWAHRFASEEAPHLIREGGKEGVRSLVPTLNRLGQLVRASLTDSTRNGQQGSTNLPQGYRTSRVQRAIQELAVHLEEAHELAEEISNSENED